MRLKPRSSKRNGRVLLSDHKLRLRTKTLPLQPLHVSCCNRVVKRAESTNPSTHKRLQARTQSTLEHVTQALEDRKITFGVEMEVLIHVNPEAYRACLPKAHRHKSTSTLAEAISKPGGEHERLVRKDIAAILRKYGVRVNTVPVGEESETAASFTRWTIATDHTINCDNEYVEGCGRTAVIGVEFITPCFETGNDAFKHISEVVDLVSASYTVTVNKSCELHVHVGLLDPVTKKQTDFITASCKNLATLTSAFEKQFDTLCSSILLQDTHCRPLSTRFAENNGLDLVTAIDHIRAATSRRQLCRIMSKSIDDRAYSINFQNMHPDARLGTIEFRQHAGCFDAQRIVKRVELVAGFVGWALLGNDLDHLLWLQRAGIDVDILKLLRLIGIKEDVVEFYSDRLFSHV